MKFETVLLAYGKVHRKIWQRKNGLRQRYMFESWLIHRDQAQRDEIARLKAELAIYRGEGFKIKCEIRVRDTQE